MNIVVRKPFGGFISDVLVRKKLTLREVARRSGIDASNLSKIERGVVYPPQKRETLERLADALELDLNEKTDFFDIARLENEMMPSDLKNVVNNPAIPLLLRTIDNRQLTAEEIKKLAEIVANENSWQGRIIK